MKASKNIMISMEKKMKIYNPMIYTIDYNFYMKGKDK